MPTNFIFKNINLLYNYIYIDREERKKFYLNKHEYIVEQIYYTNPVYLNNLNNKIYIESINPCKYFIFMAQVKYFLNYNVNQNFNYDIYFFYYNLINNIFSDPSVNLIFLTNNKSVINSAYFSLNSNQAAYNYDFKLYSTLIPFFNYPMAKNESSFGMTSFSLYPDTLQPSGSCNLSYFSSFEINATFNPIDVNYNQYVFKCYTVSYNFLKIVNGVAAPIFNSPF